jgi:tetratricopeptide (TPR) repeat protein
MLLILADRYQENQQHDRFYDALERAYTLSRGIQDVGLRSRAACAKAMALVDQAPGDPATVSLADRLLAEALSQLAASPGSEADEAYCQVREANVGNKLGDGTRSLTAAKRAVAIEEVRGAPATRRFEAGLVLANSYMIHGATGSADAEFERTMRLLESQGLGRSRDAALDLNNWSRVWQLEGHYLKALPLSERALDIGRERATERGAVAPLVRSLAAVLCTIGRCEEALPLIEEAIAKAREEKSRRRLVGALQQAALVFIGVGRLDRAADALAEAERLLREDPRSTPSQYAVLDQYLSRLALDQGDPGAALAYAERGLARPPVHYEVLPLQFLLAEARNERGEFALARAMAERALPTAREIEDERPSIYTGRGRLERGIALAGLGETEAGREDLRAALEQLEASVGPDAPPTLRARRRLESLERARASVFNP